MSALVVPERPQLSDLIAPVQSDLEAVDQYIRAWLRSDIPLVNQIAEYIVAAGGKRLRPLVALLAARACGIRGKEHVALAAIVEFIHTATLLHDDVVDESSLRRGRRTANLVYGNAASVLVGDFLYSRAFQMMVGLDRMRVMEVLADTTNRIAEGEVLQLMYAGDPELGEAQYLEVVERKTAVLFAAAARLGAVLAQTDAALEQALADFGHHLGMAFQLVDDALDYSGDEAEIGKAVGDDLAQGKVTLPLIVARERAPAEAATIIRAAIRDGRREHLSELCVWIDRTAALATCIQRARQYAERAAEALTPLSPSCHRDALLGLTRFAVARRH